MKTRIIIKNILFIIVGIIIFLSAIGKFAHREAIVALFTPLGMEDYMIRIATIQLIIVVCLAWKPLRSLGVLVASAFLGSMMAMMVATGSNPLSAALTLLLLWTAYKLEWWGYWKHYDNDCSCGWCKRKPASHHHDFKTNCDCKDGVCKC